MITSLLLLLAQQTAFVDVTVVPMDREGVLEHHTVLVEGDRIVSVGPKDDITLPDGTTVIDGTGRWLMPGLADMHVHTWFEGELPLFLANGVTTVRNMFGSPMHLQWRDSIARGERLGPSIVTAGPIVDGSPPYWPGSREIMTPEDARAAVQEHVDAGYDFLKVYARVPVDAYAALMEAAREAGLAVHGHVPDAVGARSAMNAGQHTLEHLFGFEQLLADEELHGFLDRLQVWEHVDDERLTSVAKEVRASGAFICPTLVVMQKFLPPELAAAEMERDCMRYVPPYSMSMWKSMELPMELSTAAQAGHAGRLRMVRALHEAGVPLLLGTDMGNAWVVAGFSIHEELANLVAAGLTPYAALRAGTRTAAECLDATGEFGAVATGLRADLLLLEADPLTDVAHVGRRAGVMARGRWYPESDLQARLEALVAPK